MLKKNQVNVDGGVSGQQGPSICPSMQMAVILLSLIIEILQSASLGVLV